MTDYTIHEPGVAAGTVSYARDVHPLDVVCHQRQRVRLGDWNRELPDLLAAMSRSGHAWRIDPQGCEWFITSAGIAAAAAGYSELVYTETMFLPGPAHQASHQHETQGLEGVVKPR